MMHPHLPGPRPLAVGIGCSSRAGRAQLIERTPLLFDYRLRRQLARKLRCELGRTGPLYSWHRPVAVVPRSVPRICLALAASVLADRSAWLRSAIAILSTVFPA
jgi:hypothetical protein